MCRINCLMCLITVPGQLVAYTANLYRRAWQRVESWNILTWEKVSDELMLVCAGSWLRLNQHDLLIIIKTLVCLDNNTQATYLTCYCHTTLHIVQYFDIVMFLQLRLYSGYSEWFWLFPLYLQPVNPLDNNRLTP
ncbi:hypothetical protein RRG08_016814 [Elysia crispata]|uniref:Uncharacterized protein n=1 Tax=Elysia crispata TaxID=231223 RepID=A0AAE1DQC6_9GAST|nr:hypothetical protein RRG08_016814 [Elysia crispata]